MTIGTALIIIAVLYLIERHHLWKIVAKVAAGVAVVALLAGGAYWGWSKYQDHKAAAKAVAMGVPQTLPANFTGWDKQPADLKCSDLGPEWEEYTPEHPFGASPSAPHGFSDVRDAKGYPVCWNKTTLLESSEIDWLAAEATSPKSTAK